MVTRVFIMASLLLPACGGGAASSDPVTTSSAQPASAERETGDQLYIELVEVELRIAEASISYGDEHPARRELEAERQVLLDATPGEPAGDICSWLERKELEIEQNIARLSARYGPLHPTMRAASATRDVVAGRARAWCDRSLAPSP